MAYLINDDCINCGICSDECPTESIEEGQTHYEILAGNCTDCGTCAEVCPVNAVIDGS